MRAAQLLMPLALALLIAGAPVQTAAGGVGLWIYTAALAASHWDVTKSRKYKSIDEKIEMLVLESDYEILELRYERRVQWLISYLATLPRDSVQYKAVQKERVYQNAQSTSVRKHFQHQEAQQARAPLGGPAMQTGGGDVSEAPRPVRTGTEADDRALMMAKHAVAPAKIVGDLDTNHDGKISREELVARLKQVNKELGCATHRLAPSRTRRSAAGAACASLSGRACARSGEHEHVPPPSPPTFESHGDL